MKKQVYSIQIELKNKIKINYREKYLLISRQPFKFDKLTNLKVSIRPKIRLVSIQIVDGEKQTIYIQCHSKQSALNQNKRSVKHFFDLTPLLL